MGKWEVAQNVTIWQPKVSHKDTGRTQVSNKNPAAAYSQTLKKLDLKQKTAGREKGKQALSPGRVSALSVYFKAGFPLEVWAIWLLLHVFALSLLPPSYAQAHHISAAWMCRNNEETQSSPVLLVLSFERWAAYMPRQILKSKQLSPRQKQNWEKRLLPCQQDVCGFISFLLLSRPSPLLL